MAIGLQKDKLADARAQTLSPFLDHVKEGLPFLVPGLSDYEVIISAASGIEKLCEIAIALSFRAKVSSSEMNNIFHGQGPLATFSAKIHLCCAIGLIPAPLRPDVDKIKAIRNAFAHSMNTKRFLDQDIASRCSQLTLETTAFDLSKIPIGPRHQFISSCIKLYEFMLTSISLALVSTEFYVQSFTKLQPAGIALALEIRKLAGFPMDGDNHNHPKPSL
jgi:DNA-binding MltR family transcriptional regulator